jgi:5-amino-6-(5-phospho-D-ribitylamino)uracil phosphatase
MNLSRYKLVVSDLDGTLVKYGSNSLSETAKTSIDYLRQQGINFTVATGRSWEQTKGIIRELSITVPVIVQAGALIVDPVSEKTLRMQPLRKSIEKKLRKLLKLAYGVDQFCLDASGTYFTTQVNTAGGDWLVNSEKCHVADWQTLNFQSIIKHLFIGPEQEMKRLSEKIYLEIKPTPNMILWPPDPECGDWFLEVFDPSSSKGQALSWLARLLRIKLDQVIAFGDGYNDLDMLQRAGLGIAMEKAPDLVLSKADLTIPGPDHDGIPRFLMGTM